MNGKKTIVLAALCAAAVGCQATKAPEEQSVAPEKPPVPVEARAVSMGVVRRQIQASGTASGIREAMVVSQTQGTVRRVSFELGQYVKKGQVLVVVDDDVQQAAVAQAEKSAETAKLSLEVTRKLFSDGNASEAELKQAQVAATGAEAQLRQARLALTNCRIVAPFGGYIAQKDLTLEEGGSLAPGTPVTRVVDLSSLRTIVPVGEMDVAALKRNMKATVRVPAIGNHEFSGTVRAVGAGSNMSTGSFPVEIVWKNSGERAIKSGMSVRVRIETEQPDSVMLVPAKSIVNVDRRDAAYVESNGKAAVRFVEVGRFSGHYVEILEGLEPGDALITSGMTTLARGDSVLVTMTGNSGSNE